MINWKVRIKNKAFWLFIIPAILLLIKEVGDVFGLNLDFTLLANELKEVVEAVFMVLIGLGIVVDPTTKGIPDGAHGITYDEPQ